MIDFGKVNENILRTQDGKETKEYTYSATDGERGMSDEEVLMFQLHKENDELKKMIEESNQAIDQASMIKSLAKMAQKIAKVIEQTKTIEKSGWNSFHKYEYATESDVKKGVRNVMAENKLILMNNVKKYEENIVQTKNGGKESQVKLHIEYTLIDTETGFSKTFTKIGVGQDAGDKAFYKAETGALKYALTTLFLLPSGDGDPEINSQENDGTDAKSKPQEKELLKMKTTAEFILKATKLEQQKTIVGFLQDVANKNNILDDKGNAKNPDDLTVADVAKMNNYLSKWKLKVIDDLKTQQKQNEQMDRERMQQQTERQHQQAKQQKDAKSIFGGRN